MNIPVVETEIQQIF
jgi:hypothetical protein